MALQERGPRIVNRRVAQKNAALVEQQKQERIETEAMHAEIVAETAARKAAEAERLRAVGIDWLPAGYEAAYKQAGISLEQLAEKHRKATARREEQDARIRAENEMDPLTYLAESSIQRHKYQPELQKVNPAATPEKMTEIDMWAAELHGIPYETVQAKAQELMAARMPQTETISIAPKLPQHDVVYDLSSINAPVIDTISTPVDTAVPLPILPPRPVHSNIQAAP